MALRFLCPWERYCDLLLFISLSLASTFLMASVMLCSSTTVCLDEVEPIYLLRCSSSRVAGR